MGSLARADLETLLHTKKLDRTLTRADGVRPDLEYASTGHVGLDARMSGGVPRGQVSELVGPRSSGRTAVMLQMIAAATRRGELVALIDALDMFDVESAAACGVDFDRLLWIRGLVVMNPGMCRDLNQRAVVQAVRALTLVLDARNFGLVVFDAGEAPSDAVRRLPFTTWLRLQRMVEGTSTVCLLVGSDRLSRSPRGLSLQASTLRAVV
jgi:hypothetical protein